MNWKMAALALVSALMLLPSAAAQATVTADEEVAAIAPESTATLGFTAFLSCGDFAGLDAVTGAGSVTKTLTLTYPAGLSGAETVDVTFSGMPCASNPTGSTSATGSVDVTAAPEAPGMQDLPIAVADDGADAGSLVAKVGYRMGHSFITDVEFPLEVDGDSISWNATLLVTANADTMVMTLKEEKLVYGSVTGLFDFMNFRDIPANGSAEMLALTYTPAGHDWEEDTLVFKMWSHYINDGAMKTDDEVITWTFVNTHSHEEEDAKGSPGFGGIMALAIVGAAAMALRRAS